MAELSGLLRLRLAPLLLSAGAALRDVPSLEVGGALRERRLPRLDSLSRLRLDDDSRDGGRELMSLLFLQQCET